MLIKLRKSQRNEIQTMKWEVASAIQTGCAYESLNIYQRLIGHNAHANVQLWRRNSVKILLHARNAEDKVCTITVSTEPLFTTYILYTVKLPNSVCLLLILVNWDHSHAETVTNLYERIFCRTGRSNQWHRCIHNQLRYGAWYISPYNSITCLIQKHHINHVCGKLKPQHIFGTAHTMSGNCLHILHK